MEHLLKRLSAGVVLIIIYYIFNEDMINKDAIKYYASRQQQSKSFKIYDIGHKYIQNLSANHYAKYLCDALVVLSVIIAYLAFSVSGFTELMALQISIFIFRFITINLTILPNNKPSNNEYTLYNFFLDNVYDHQFSGHMAYMILLLILVLKYNITWLIIPSIIMNIVMATLLIATRVHYSIDIVLSVVVCLFFMLFGIKAKL